MKVRIAGEPCIVCGLCREACPEGAVHPALEDVHHRLEVIAAECTGCGVCFDYCPAPGALVQYEDATILGPRGGS
jgi:Pyruvate/2-oxoacid:ferredoxin oxidoreductase delta subunit